MSRFNVAHNSDMNVTPFVDVMMVLLIVLMVAVPTATKSHKMDIPPADASAQAAQPPTIVTLQEDGTLFVDDHATTMARLPADVAAALGGPRHASQRVYLRAQRGVRYGALMGVLNQLHSGGFRQVAIVSEEL